MLHYNRRRRNCTDTSNNAATSDGIQLQNLVRGIMIKKYRYIGENVNGMFTKGKTYEFETIGNYFLSDDDGDRHYWRGIDEGSEFEPVESETELQYPKVEKEEFFFIETMTGEIIELTRSGAEQLHKKLGELL